MKSEKIRIIFAVIIAGLIGYSIGVTKIHFDWKGFAPHVDIAGKETPPSVIQADFSQNVGCSRKD